jgi:hypothetical protein
VPPVGFAPGWWGEFTRTGVASARPAARESGVVEGAAPGREPEVREGVPSGFAWTIVSGDWGAAAASRGTGVGEPSPTTRLGSLTAARAAAPKATATTMIVRILLTPSPGIADAL